MQRTSTTIRIAVIVSLLIVVLPVTIIAAEKAELWVFISGPGKICKALEEAGIIERFEAAHPGVTVRLDNQDNYGVGWKEALVPHILSGSFPDVITVWDAQWIDEGLYLDLSAFLEKDPDINPDDFVGAPAKLFDGQLLGIPMYGREAWPFYYNIGYYKEAAVEEPMQSYLADRWTIEQFIDGARKLTVDRDGDGKVDQYGYAGHPNYDLYHNHHMAVFGATVMGADGKTVLLDSPEAIRAVDFLRSLIWDHGVLVMGSLPRIFAQGQAASFMGIPAAVLGNPELQAERDAGRLKVGIAPSLKESNDAPLRMGSLIDSGHRAGIGVGSQSQNPELAWKFIKLLLTDEYQEVFMEASAEVVGRKTLLPQFADLMQPLVDSDSSILVDILLDAEPQIQGTSCPYYYRNQPNGVWGVWTKALGEVFAGRMDTERALTQAADQIRAIIQE